MRTQQRPVGRRGVELLLPPLDRDDQIGIARRAQAGQFAVQVGHFRRAGTLVQVVYVLRQDLDLEIPFQPRDGLVPGIGLRGEHLAAAHVVKSDDHGTVMRQRLGRADILDPVGSP